MRFGAPSKSTGGIMSMSACAVVAPLVRQCRISPLDSAPRLFSPGGLVENAVDGCAAALTND
jgi:hypothetical protein